MERTFLLPLETAIKLTMFMPVSYTHLIMGAYRQFGFLLLRNRFFKSACFQCNIQQWFRDHGITKISQLNGFTLADKVEQIRLITTPSSIKYLKFGKLKDWLQKIDPVFGVVKHEKATPFFDGRLVQLHYQLLNTLPLQEDVYKRQHKPL